MHVLVKEHLLNDSQAYNFSLISPKKKKKKKLLSGIELYVVFLFSNTINLSQWIPGNIPHWNSKFRQSALCKCSFKKNVSLCSENQGMWQWQCTVPNVLCTSLKSFPLPVALFIWWLWLSKNAVHGLLNILIAIILMAAYCTL